MMRALVALTLVTFAAAYQQGACTNDNDKNAITGDPEFFDQTVRSRSGMLSAVQYATIIDGLYFL